MQGGQGEVKHWAFNDPPKREGRYRDAPPPPEEYRKLQDPRDRPAPDDGDPERPDLRRRPGVAGAHPGGHRRPGRDLEGREGLDLAGRHHDNPFGMRLTTLMISKQIPDTAVPMSLLADHPNVQFNFYRHGLGTVATEMH